MSSFVDSNIAISSQKPVKRKIYMWKKADTQKLKSKIKEMSSARTISLISLRYWLLVIVFEDQLISGKFRSPPIQMVDFVFLWQMSEMMFDRSLEYSMLLNTITSNQYRKEISEIFLALEEDLGLIQSVNFPTRGQHLLDVFFTNRPSLINRCEPIPGR
jgi:hypothetical protein